jgi:hypothetical protein
VVLAPVLECFHRQVAQCGLDSARDARALKLKAKKGKIPRHAQPEYCNFVFKL